jgi:hypothetical protein
LSNLKEGRKRKEKRPIQVKRAKKCKKEQKRAQKFYIDPTSNLVLTHTTRWMA